MSLLEVVELTAGYHTEEGFARAVHNVSFSIEPGENLGIVGESGCGKSSLTRAIIRVFPRTFSIERGRVRLLDRDLTGLSEAEMRRVRWKKVSYIPQSAMNALNPVYTVGQQIAEPIQEHESVSRREARRRVKEVLEWVGIDPERIDQYPHQFSGGMRQRVSIASALSLEPDLIIADEPTTALDVIVQAHIFQKLREMQTRTGASLLLVTHDISLVAENCARVAVMYAGCIVEYGHATQVLVDPCHPYTMGLRHAFPSVDRSDELELVSIHGAPPSLVEPAPGCQFANRCPFATEVCARETPTLDEVEPGHFAACHHSADDDQMREQASHRRTWEYFG
ncbi:MAG TPA: ABC transporter ATP-binding protein [Vicinamibacteria bacterium]|nr:ABC transporter ATP-binding protein [Vicinamibacteria bacterium]